MNDDIRRTTKGQPTGSTRTTRTKRTGTRRTGTGRTGTRRTRNANRKFAPWLGVTVFLIIAGVAWLGASFTATGSDSGTPISPEPGLSVALTVQPLQLADDTVYVFTLGVMAADGQVVTFNSGQTYDFVVAQHGRNVWRWSQGRAFHQAFVERTFKSGELHAFTVVWDGRDANGEPVTGPIEVRGVLTSVPPIETDTISLELD